MRRACECVSRALRGSASGSRRVDDALPCGTPRVPSDQRGSRSIGAVRHRSAAAPRAASPSAVRAMRQECPSRESSGYSSRSRELAGGALMIRIVWASHLFQMYSTPTSHQPNACLVYTECRNRLGRGNPPGASHLHPNAGPKGTHGVVQSVEDCHCPHRKGAGNVPAHTSLPSWRRREPSREPRSRGLHHGSKKWVDFGGRQGSSENCRRLNHSKHIRHKDLSQALSGVYRSCTARRLCCGRC